MTWLVFKVTVDCGLAESRVPFGMNMGTNIEFKPDTEDVESVLRRLGNSATSEAAAPMPMSIRLLTSVALVPFIAITIVRPYTSYGVDATRVVHDVAFVLIVA